MLLSTKANGQRARSWINLSLICCSVNVRTDCPCLNEKAMGASKREFFSSWMNTSSSTNTKRRVLSPKLNLHIDVAEMWTRGTKQARARTIDRGNRLKMTLGQRRIWKSARHVSRTVIIHFGGKTRCRSAKLITELSIWKRRKHCRYQCEISAIVRWSPVLPTLVRMSLLDYLGLSTRNLLDFRILILYVR